MNRRLCIAHRIKHSIFDRRQKRLPFEVHEVAGKIICNAFATERKKKVRKSGAC
jgi:hypothetical protein